MLGIFNFPKIMLTMKYQGNLVLIAKVNNPEGSIRYLR